MPASAAHFDYEGTLERVGHDVSLLREITGIFLETYPLLLAEIAHAVEVTDAGALRWAAHSLKGAVSTFGMSGAASVALELELMGKYRELDGATEALQRLRQRLEDARHALEAMLGPQT